MRINVHFCQFFQEETFFYILMQHNLILQFWRNAALLNQTLYLLLQAALCNQPTVNLRHWKRYRRGTFKPYCTPLWTIGFSIAAYIKLWWSDRDLQKNALKIWGTRSTVDILTSDKNFSFLKIIFPALIDIQSNFEISRLIRLVVSGMFLLPCSASLMCFSSF